MSESAESESWGTPVRGPARRLSVLHVTNTIGETSMCYNELALPLRHRHDIAMCSYFPLSVVPPPEISLFGGDGSLAGFLRRLTAALSSRKFDIVHAHAAAAGILFLASTVLRGRSMRSSVFTVHSSYPHIKLKNKLLLLPIFAAFGRVACCSSSSGASLPSLYRRLAGDRLRVVPNGVDTERIARVVGGGRHDAAPGRFTVVSVGRLIEVKDPLAVLDGFRRADLDGELVFIGEGDLRIQVSTAGRDFPPNKRVSMTGLIPRDQVYERLARADLFVSASRGEGLPVAALEAMACARPVLLSDIAPHREIASGADFIPLIPLGDGPRLSMEMERFARMGPEERSRLGARCKTLAEERFGLAATHRAYEQIYDDLLRGRRAAEGR